MDKKRVLIGFGLIVLLIIGSVIALYPDWLWFNNLGFSPVFMKMLISRYGFGAIVWLLLILLISVNIFAAKRLNPGYSGGAYLKEKGSYAAQFGISDRTLNTIILVFILILSLVVAAKSSNHWDLILRYLYQKPFGTVDPIFKRDIGFYMFTFPLLILVKNGLIFLVALSTLVTAGWYLKYGALQIEGDVPMDGTPPSPPTIKITPNAKRHLIFLCGIILIFIAWGFYLDIYELLFSTQGPAFGASYTDVNIRIICFRILFILTLIFAGMLIYKAFKPDMKMIWKGGIAWVAAIVLLSYVIPPLAQKLIVKPNELARESPYIEHNIKFTREAYNLNKMKEVMFNVSDTITPDVIAKNDATIQNIRVWDERPLLQTYRQLESLRLYYDFNNVDVDRYQIDGNYRQIMLSARELVANQLPPQANTWVNRHLIYTHGYGIVANPVNEVTKEGLPDLIVKDIPPTTSQPDMRIDRPEIYFGEKTEDYILIKTKEKEFDYGKGDNNVFTIYQGEGGVPIGSFIRRLLFAVEFMDPQILFTTSLTPESRIMYNRRIRNRLNILAPFLQYDRDPYIVVSNGKLYWIMDAYTTSDMYPYSVRYPMPGTKKNVNYIRNSVKVVVNAYNGRVSFYAMDDKDPILKTYEAIFPNLFKPFDTMPEGLKKHIRYPKDLFKIQVGTYTRYHMEDVQVFYNQEDLWQVPDELYGDSRIEMEPYYIILKLPDEKREEFFLMQPVTPYQKDNMIGWIAARCDEPDYGNLLVYKLPKEKLVYGPMQIEARVDQQTEISRELSLWDQRGSRVIRGNLLAIPIGHSFIYAEPVYLEAKQESSSNAAPAQAQKGFFPRPQAGGPGGTAGRGTLKASASLPELKRIIVAFGNRLVMKERLDEALNAILETGGAPEQPIAEETVTPAAASGSGLSEMATEALEHYNKAKEYLKQDDWAGYGKELDQLEKILETLSKKDK